jgi:lipopolysaccharide/colanic/teichoic acid biosynthesis glycosyltransferase
MKKNRHSYTRQLFRYKPELAFSGTGAIATAAYPVVPSKPRRKKYTPRPHLEKIGGMEKEVRNYVSLFCDISSTTTSIVRTSIKESIQQLPSSYQTIINLKRINDVKEINRFLSTVNHRLPEAGTFIGCVETKYLRKQRLLKKYPLGLNYLFLFIDFLYKRVFPKLPVTRQFCTFLTRDRNKVLSRTETLGRLYAAGFEVVDKKFIGHNLYFVARKKKNPLFDFEPAYGPIFRMRRHGKNGKVIYVYKMRTMHAYSEYIQQYVYEKNKLAEGGKMKDDFRVSTLGRFFRKYWIDELPMLYNLIRGDLKIVGVRPLSAHYLSLYSEDLREMRLRHKPGLIPPFYADLPKTIEEIQESERRYLAAYEKNPLLTDMKYIMRVFYNILFRKARSK